MKKFAVLATLGVGLLLAPRAEAYCQVSNVVPVTFGPSLHATGGWNRHLTSGSSRLAYQLYVDPQRTRIFGDGTGNTHIREGTYFLIGAFGIVTIEY